MTSVAIIGAGPAGCAAAIALGTIGVRCVLFERGRAGKDKACGDGFVPSAVRALQRLGVDEGDLVALGGEAFHGVSLYGSAEDPLHVMKGDFEGWVIRRAAIDQHLRMIAATRCDVSYETVVSAVDPYSGGIRLHLRDRAHESFAAAIIAAGSGSLLSRIVQISGDPAVALAVSAYAANKKAIKHLECYLRPSLRPGYGWRFPVNQSCSNVGVCLLGPSTGSRLRSVATAFGTSLGLYSSLPWRGGSAHLWSGRAGLWHRPEGVVSCGDAAGLVDPSSGEGLTAALISGWEAGRAVGLFVVSGRDARMLEQYSSWVREYFKARYARAVARDMWNAWIGLGARD